MDIVDRNLSSADALELKAFLDNPARPANTLSFHELQGFLFAIASSPETIPTSAWLPLISDDEDLDFDDDDEAQRILGSIMVLYNEVNTAVLERSELLPPGCSFNDDVVANFDENASISQWSRGFLLGHDWLAEVWEEYLLEEMDEECGAAMMVLSFFSSRQLAEAYFDDSRPTRKRSVAKFEQFAEKIRGLFPSALASYSHIGRTIFEFLLEKEDTDETRH